jgi:hypothetical protein
MRRQQYLGRQRWVDQEQAEAVLQLQQAAVGVRQGEAQLEDVQAVTDYYSQRAAPNPTMGSDGTGNGSTAAAEFKPGDWVFVPSATQSMEFLKVRVTKARMVST